MLKFLQNRAFASLLCCIVCLVLAKAVPLSAQQPAVKIVESAAAHTQVHLRENTSIEAAPGVPVRLDEQALLTAVNFSEHSLRGASPSKTIELPQLDGSVRSFRVEPSGTLPAALQARYPELLAFRGYALDDPAVRVRVEYSPRKGWTAAMHQDDGSSTYLAARGQTNTTRSYRLVKSRDLPQAFTCHVDHGDQDAALQAVAQRSLAGDCELRRYDLAITCTGEYAQAVDGPSPTTAGVLAAMNVAVNRVNEVYERDLAITFVLNDRNDELLFFNGNTDPYTEGSPGAMINESQQNIDALIGPNSYDIGHIFSTQGGGLAQLRSPCTSNRARGVTGITNPTGDGFYIDYVAHEIGHQFGGTHTFYNSCGGNRTQGTAYEPGSGSTIMAYAGICSPNVQNRSDDYFHAASIAQIADFVTGATGGSCPDILPTNNTAPQVDPLPNYSIPIGTAFELTATATDPDGDALTYTWEQFDNVLGGAMPPEGTNVDGPLFRSLEPSASPTRRFPSGSFNTYEVLPTVERDLNFRVTVRDNNGQVGCTSEQDVLLQTVGNTPFRITNYNSPATLEGFEDYTITWDVAGTNQPPIDAGQVDIFLSLDGGFTYDYTLATAVANTGVATVNIPNIDATGARFVVKASDNVFLDVNDANLTIEASATSTFLLSVGNGSFISCGVGAVSYALQITTQLGFSEAVTLSVGGLPAGVSGSFSANGQQGDFTSILSLQNTASLANGTYGFTVTATSATVTRDINLLLVKQSVPPQAPMALSPADGEQVGRVFTSFSWSYDGTQGSVRFQLSQDPRFTTGNTFTQDFDQASILASGIVEGIWYWRVAYVNDCGVSDYGPLMSFQQIPLEEETTINDTPVTIGDGNGDVYTSTIDITRTGQVYRVEAGVLITHTYVGDLDGQLTFPGNVDYTLFDRPSGGGCTGNNLSVLFADDAQATAADFVDACSANIPSISGTFTPVDQFFPQLPREGLGTYTLTITDNEFQDGGSLDEWALSLWYADLPEYNEQLTTNVLRVPSGQNRVVAASNLRAATAQVGNNAITWVIKELSPLGELRDNDVVLGVGDFFTQQDIDDGQITFVHDVSSTGTQSQITFDVLLDTDGYRPNITLPIEIIVNSLQISASVTGTLACAGDETAQVSATATGGTPPYSYSLNGGPFQSSGTFDNLPAGLYTVTAKDADDFTVQSTALAIDDPAALTLSTTVSGNVITAMGQGGTGALTYSLDGGAAQSSGVFSNVANGVHTVTVIDANGCTASEQVVISVDALIVDLQIEEDINCNGDRGVLLAAAAGGQGPYQYSLNGGPNTSDPRFSNLSAGSYTVTVTDALGQMVTSSPPVVLSEPAALTLSAQVVNSSITLTAAGGTTPYSYSLDGNSYQTSATFSQLANGTYTLYVRDANGCVSTTTASVQVNNLVVEVELLAEPTCNGETNGSIQATAAGGQAPYTYQLNGGAFQSSGVFSGLAAGSYVVTARDANGLERTSASITLTEPAAVTLSAQVSGNNVTLTAGGGTAPYTYSVDGGPFQTGNVFGPLGQGSHQFVVLDANGCEAATSATIAASDLAVSVSFNLGQESCPGAADGAVTLSGLNGTPPYEFSIGNGQFQSGSFFGALAPGTYTATVRDALGAEASTVFEILARQEPTVSVAVDGSRVALSGFTPAASNVRYSFDGGATFTSDSTGYVYSAGPFDVIVRYGSCELAVPVQVTNPLVLDADNLVACAGSNQANATFCVSGGVSSYTVTVSAGTTMNVNDPNCSDAYSLSVPVSAGQSRITVTDATGASRVQTLSVSVSSPIDITGDIQGDQLSVAASGGTAPYTYSIDGGATMQAEPVFTQLPDGTVEVLVTDLNGCTSTMSFVISALLNAQQLGLRVFPNPTDRELTVELSATQGASSYRLLDATGRTVLAKAQPAGRSQLDVSQLPAGMYVLRVEHVEGTAVVPVIVR